MAADVPSPSWSVHEGSDLDARTLYDVLALRSAVFVVEQECAYQDLDGLDLVAGTRHLIGRSGDGIAAYARVLAPDEKHQAPRIGRVIVAPEARGRQLARTLMQAALEICEEHWPGRARRARCPGPPERVLRELRLRGAGGAVRRGRDPARLDAAGAVGFETLAALAPQPPGTRPYPCPVPTLLHPRYWGAHLLMLVAVAAAVLLGVWQLHVWQAARDAEARDLSNAKPLALGKVMGGDDPFPGKYLGQPVSLEGTWLPKGTLYASDRDLDGKVGYWVVTPVLVGDSAMPVVRGWSLTPSAPAPSGPARVTGWLQASEGAGVPDDDPHDDVIPEMRVASIVEHVDADLYSGFVVERGAEDGLAQVTPASIPKVSNTTSLRNLLYAFQWWIFARPRDLHLGALVPGRPGARTRRSGAFARRVGWAPCATSSPPTGSSRSSSGSC